jgi:hypothetical protein
MPLGFRMSQSSFLAVERAFGLPNDTLAVLSSNAGEYSARFINLSAQQADSVGKEAFIARRKRTPFQCR